MILIRSDCNQPKILLEFQGPGQFLTAIDWLLQTNNVQKFQRNTISAPPFIQIHRKSCKSSSFA